MTSPEDILESSLQTLYSYTPVSFSGGIYTHKASGITLRAPDPAPPNWGLHASSIWIASLFLANHIDDVLSTLQFQDRIFSVLELGAGSGLPGILVAKRTSGKAAVTLSDYADEAILHCLEENVRMNSAQPLSVNVVGCSWGESTIGLGIFDLVLAADTIWNPEQHLPFCQTLFRVLRRNEKSRIFLVAGLHTGRWTVHRFLNILEEFGFIIDLVVERKVDGNFDSDNSTLQPMERDWATEREGEEENDRRTWVVWIVVKWATSSVTVEHST